MKSTEELTQMIREKFAQPLFATFTNVADAPGFGATGFADAISMGLYTSRGLELHGFEVKRDRSDWLRELKKPEKAEKFATHCDFWWIVANKGVVQPGELPPAWGLLEPKGDKLATVTKAPLSDAAYERKKARQPQSPLPRQLIACLLRRALEQGPSGKQITEAVDEARSSTETRMRSRVDLAERKYAALQHSITMFEEASGVHISEYGGKHLGEAVKQVLQSRHTELPARLEGARRQVQLVLDELNSAITATQPTTPT